MIYHRIGKISPPHFATFLVTSRCNLKCSFCDVWRYPHDAADELSPEQITSVFAKLKTLDVVRISGGEPFLRSDMGELINRIQASARPRMIHITTNGTMKDNIVEALSACDVPRAIHLKLSIDSIGARHDELRGVAGTYARVSDTLKELIPLRSRYGFHLGVNCTISTEDDISGFYQLKDMLKKEDVPVYGVIASAAENALYSKKEIVDPDNSICTKDRFSPEALKRFFERQALDSRANSDMLERIVDRYHMRGLRNRLLKDVRLPRPICVALTSHIRILPNGDVPVCLYNGTIAGNIYRQSLQDVWYANKRVNELRHSVRTCKGCWQSCESIVSAIYTGDIWRGFF